MLDKLRKRYRARQRNAEASRWRNTPQALTERDAFAAHWGDEASRLEAITDRLVFGRVDNVDESTHYIGRIGLRDDDGEQILLDWRAPASRTFYQATGAQPQGVLRRGTSKPEDAQSLVWKTELDTSVDREDQMIFQGEGALMESLTQARDGCMSIVSRFRLNKTRSFGEILTVCS